MSIVAVNKQSDLYPKLQAFITGRGLLFNSPLWLQNYAPQNIVQCAILNNNGDVIGCFLYYRFKKAMFSFAISAPFTPHIGLYYDNPSGSVVGKNSFHKDILTEVAAYFDGLGVHSVDLSLPDEIVDTQPFIWRGYASRTRYSYLIDLAKTQEELWASLSSEKRKSINKAAKDGLRIELTTDFEQVYPLIIQSLERNRQAKNTGIIKNILFSFATPANSFAFIAYHNNVPIGASFCVVARTKAIYLFGGLDAGNKHHGAGVSCMWHSILRAKALNISYFDFEGSMNPAIERYFREFGGRLVPYYNIRKTRPLLRLLMALKKHNTA